MTSKKHRLITYGLAIMLVLVAIVCYAAFPVLAPDVPIRKMYHTNAGKVLFDHQTHASIEGIALNCQDCHHTHGGEEFEPGNCAVCHLPDPKDGAFAEKCLDCHDESEIEGTEMLKHSDAIHQQCWKCHEEYGAGPASGSDNCSKCHVI